MYALSQALADKSIFSKLPLDSKAVEIVTVALDVLTIFSLISLGGAALFSVKISLIPVIGIISLKMALITAGGSGFTTAIILIADSWRALSKHPSPTMKNINTSLTQPANSRRINNNNFSEGSRGLRGQPVDPAHSSLRYLNGEYEEWDDSSFIVSI